MAQLRLYRRIYSIQIIKTGSTIDQNYILVDPTSINASTQPISNPGITLENLSVSRESLGVYFVDLNPNFYTWEEIYNITWVVNYTPTSSQKKLLTSFKLHPINIGSEIELEIINSNIELEIINNTLDIDIEP